MTRRSKRSLAAAYAQFRGGKWFLITLTAIVAFWITWTELAPAWMRFDDPEFGRLNLFLSTEASLSVALLIMAGEKREAELRRQLAHIERLVEMNEKQLELMEAHYGRAGG